MLRLRLAFRVYIFFVMLLSALLAGAPASARTGYGAPLPGQGQKGQGSFSRLEIPFVENKGQVADEGVRFYARTFSGLHAVTEKGEIMYVMPGVVLRERLLGGREASPMGLGESPTVVSVFKGNRRDQWKAGIPAYGAVSLGEPYPRVELHVRVAGNTVEKVFHVEPGGRPEDIRLRIDGAQSVRVTGAGELEVTAAGGTATFTKPVAYQEIDGGRVFVETQYSLEMPPEGIPAGFSDVPSPTPDRGITYSFALAPYDAGHRLIIDPMLTATYFGGSGTDYPAFLAVGPDTSIYMAGLTFSSDFPCTEGAFQNYAAGQGDVFVARLDRTLSTLEAATYLGGDGAEGIGGMKISGSGEVYLTGTTYSKDFPYTEGAYDTSFQSAGYDETVFVSRLNGSLSELLSSTFLGGQGETFSSGMEVDAENRVYVAGYGQCGFPVTEGAYMTGCPPGLAFPGFIALLDGSLSSLVASTYYDYPVYALSLGASGHIYVAGTRPVPSAPTMMETVVGKLDGSLTALMADTTAHGPYPGKPAAMALDGEENVFVAGSAGPGFPVTNPAGSSSLIGKYCHIFVAKFGSTLGDLSGSVCLGSDTADPRVDSFQGLALNGSGEPSIVGYTARQFPTTPVSYQPICISYKAFVTRLNSSLTGMVASTCLGGSSQDFGYAITADPSDGGLYVAGKTSSADFPVTPEAYDRVWDGVGKLFVAKIDGALSPDLRLLTVSPAGTGKGEITSDPPGILCGPDCSEFLAEGSVVVLTATPAVGSVFAGWSEPDCGSAATCRVVMTGHKTVSATFAACTYDVKPVEKVVPFRGAKVSVAVSRTGPSACGKPSIGEVERWITGAVQSWDAKKGKGAARIAVEKNASSEERWGAILIGGSTFSVGQAGTPCVMKALSPANKAVPHDGVAEESFSVSVDPQDCRWYTAMTDADGTWISVSPNAGTGNGSLAYAVGTNDTGRARVGKVAVHLSQDARKKKVFTVRQAK